MIRTGQDLCVSRSHPGRIAAHIRHKHLQQRAAEFKDSRPGMTTRGFGPEQFAQMRLSRRSKQGPNPREPIVI
jgi:hypothetical protein